MIESEGPPPSQPDTSNAGHHLPARSTSEQNSKGNMNLRWRVRCMAVLGLSSIHVISQRARENAQLRLRRQQTSSQSPNP
jgi:hypothetical protein